MAIGATYWESTTYLRRSGLHRAPHRTICPDPAIAGSRNTTTDALRAGEGFSDGAGDFAHYLVE
jgi:hypothetical protein